MNAQQKWNGMYDKSECIMIMKLMYDNMYDKHEINVWQNWKSFWKWMKSILSLNFWLIVKLKGNWMKNNCENFQKWYL